ncbi:MAG: hypothetical protein ACP5JG_03030 [Anaerolineae bacterium]
MAEKEGFTLLAARGSAEAKELIGRLFDVARPEAVYGEPMRAGEYTLITASEASVSMGFGFGVGAGEPQGEIEGAEGTGAAQEAGGGGGGGGYAASRAIAVISVGPNGVVVEPVVDVTKIVLAFFTMFGAFLMMLGKMRRGLKG